MVINSRSNKFTHNCNLLKQKRQPVAPGNFLKTLGDCVLLYRRKTKETHQPLGDLVWREVIMIDDKNLTVFRGLTVHDSHVFKRM